MDSEKALRGDFNFAISYLKVRINKVKALRVVSQKEREDQEKWIRGYQLRLRLWTRLHVEFLFPELKLAMAFSKGSEERIRKIARLFNYVNVLRRY